MPTSVSDIKRYRENFQGEVDASSTYRALANLEKQAPLKDVYNRLAGIEEKHIDFWEQKLQEAGVRTSRRASARARIMIFLARKLGIGFILPTLVSGEQIASHTYDGQPEVKDGAMPGEEQSHARVLKAIGQATRSTGMEGGALARFEGRHRAVGGNALRAAVLGANDGLVSTLSLVMGVAGGVSASQGGSQTIALAGVAGTLAGACAMAMGEWLSVQSARELAERQIAIEASELAECPREEMEELALIYQSKGLPKDEAHSLAEKLISDKGTALDTLTREELGLDPSELGGSAWEAAIASFCLFFVGALSPVLPFLFIHDIHHAVFASLGCSAVALVLLGFMTHVMTGRGLWFSGLRQLLIGLAAAGITFGMGMLIGRLFGITVAG
jgi:VIT1/CCC1 family predicted Fe2+/Mn2+ transporter